MGLVVCPLASLRSVETAIAAASHGLTDTNGDKITTSTIDPQALKTAALLALQIATGHVMWPGDEPLRIKKPRQVQGVVEYSE